MDKPPASASFGEHRPLRRNEVPRAQASTVGNRRDEAGAPPAGAARQEPRPTPTSETVGRRYEAAGAGRYKFPARLRIKRQRDFHAAIRRGLRANDERLTVWLIPNDLAETRVGLVVGRKHGNAVTRNRLKRIIREAFRLCRAELPVGFDLVCTPRLGRRLTLAGTIESLLRLARRLAREDG
jgi:ribonuclease P protein component